MLESTPSFQHLHICPTHSNKNKRLYSWHLSYISLIWKPSGSVMVYRPLERRGKTSLRIVPSGKVTTQYSPSSTMSQPCSRIAFFAASIIGGVLRWRSGTGGVKPSEL